MKRSRNSLPTVILLVSLLLIGTAASSARAASITFNLDAIIDGSGLRSTASLGTLTLTDNGNYVDIVVKLENPSWKIQEMALNFDDSRFSNSSRFSLVHESLKVNEDKVKQGGYKGNFDIDIPATGNIGQYGYYSDTLKLLGGGNTILDVSDFAFKDTNNLIYASLHIGNYSNGSSVWVGASSIARPHAVPEPSTILLLGFGMLGIFFLRKMFAVGYQKAAVKSHRSY